VLLAREKPMKPPFDTNHNPRIGVAEILADGLQVVTAPNAGAMTFSGTRSYILGESEVAIIDPGPDDPRHLAALLGALGGRRVSHIIVTHTHVDHSPLARILSEKTGAPVYGFGPADAARSRLMHRLAAVQDLGGAEGIDPVFCADILIADADMLNGDGWELAAIHTPGHLSNHLCFAWQGTGELFSGDHVMGWATTLISPPDGDLGAFRQSLYKLQARPETTYHCGHGKTLHNPAKIITYILAHRQAREDQIRALLDTGPQTVAGLTQQIYCDVDPRLHRAASRNVLAHLIDLFDRDLISAPDEFKPKALYHGL